MVSSIRTILSLNAVEEVIAKFEEATQEGYSGATGQLVKLGAANGALMAVFLLAYLPLTLYFVCSRHWTNLLRKMKKTKRLKLLPIGSRR